MKKIIRQGFQFIGISGIGWIIDFTIFNLLNLKFETVSINNMISSLVAVCFVFMTSTRKTFVPKETGIDIRLKFIVYVVYQVVLILLISQLLKILAVLLFSWLGSIISSNLAAMIAKIIVTPVTMTMNFIVMKLLIERI